MIPALEALAGLAGSPAGLGGLLAGTLAGLLAGLTPGVSGRAGLLLVTPIALSLGPSAGAVFLIAFHSVVHTSGSIPAILLGAPTSAAEAATAIDGYAMARRGEAARAIGATLSASAFGGLVGALVLFLAVPAAMALIVHFGTPEIAALSALGLISIAALSGGWLSAGLMVAVLGVLIAAVGIDPFSGAPRLTFGLLDLWDGVSPAALVTGLFVAPELAARETASAAGRPQQTHLGAVLAGCAESFTHFWLMLRSSLIGVAVGLVPGLGASAAVWIAYGHARQTHASEIPYGEGAIAGVIAPEAANNSKEGGSLIPTLFLGIPASSGMGILLAAFATLGVEVGPKMLTKTPEFVFLLGWSNILSNLLAAPLCLLLAPAMARFATIRRAQVVPLALAAAMAATVLTGHGISTLAQLALFSGLGLLLKGANLPRAPLLLGFVLGPGLESGLVRSGMVYGWQALTRPGVLIILALAAAIIFASSRARREPAAHGREAGTTLLTPAMCLVGGLCVLALATAVTLPPTASAILYVAAGIGLAATAVTALRYWPHRAAATAPAASDRLILTLFLGALAVTAAINLPVGVAALVFAALVTRGGVGYVSAGLIALAAAGAALGLETLTP
ncbi:tripartite tricarboxylate transporter permease [Phenylobacterium sp.]|uniref:tripartite tricarboxylate transporter permease n=1 Tax=Phenylobacterium sp. TaxID=1871053 RepID=UPI003BAC766B